MVVMKQIKLIATESNKEKGILEKGHIIVKFPWCFNEKYLRQRSLSDPMDSLESRKVKLNV